MMVKSMLFKTVCFSFTRKKHLKLRNMAVLANVTLSNANLAGVHWDVNYPKPNKEQNGANIPLNSDISASWLPCSGHSSPKQVFF